MSGLQILGQMSGKPVKQNIYRKGHERKASVLYQGRHALESTAAGTICGTAKHNVASGQCRQLLQILQDQLGKQDPGHLISSNAAQVVPLYGQGGQLSRKYLKGQLYRDCICCCRRFPVNFKLNNGIHCSRCSSRIRTECGDDFLWWSAKAVAEKGRFPIEKIVYLEIEKRTGMDLRVAVIADNRLMQRTQRTHEANLKLRPRVRSVELTEDILDACCGKECQPKEEMYDLDNNLSDGKNKGVSISRPSFNAKFGAKFSGNEGIEEAMSYVLRNGGIITPDGELVDTGASFEVPKGYLPVIAFNPNIAARTFGQGGYV